MSHKVTSTVSSGKALLVVQEKFKTFNVGQAFWASILPRIRAIHLAGDHIGRVAMFLWHTIPQGGIHLAGNKVARVATFLHHARSPLPVVQEKLHTFNVGQAFGVSISPGIWSIHLAGNQILRLAMFLHHAILQGDIHLPGNQIVRVAMCLCHAKSPLSVVQEKPLLVVQEKLKGIQY